MLRFQETHLVFVYTIRSRHLTVLILLLFAFGGSGRTFSRPLSALVLGRRLSECMSRRWQAKGQGTGVGSPMVLVFPRNLGDVLELSRGRLYPLFSGNNDISLCKGSKCRDDC